MTIRTLTVIGSVAIFSLLPHISKAEDTYGYINSTTANVRKSPTRDAPIILQCKQFDSVVVTGGSDGAWAQVRLFVGSDSSDYAWIHESLVSTTMEQARSKAKRLDSSTSAGRATASATGVGHGHIAFGMPADTVLSILGKCDRTEVLGRDDNGVIVAWHYSGVSYIMKRWYSNGMECYRVSEIRNR